MPLTVILMIVSALCLYWPTGRLLRIFEINVRSRRVRLIRAGASLALGVLCSIWRIVFLFAIHLAVLLPLSDALVKLVKLVWKKPCFSPVRWLHRSGIGVLLLIAVFFAYGYVNMNCVRATHYTVTSGRLSQNYRIVFLSDTHYGTVQNPELLESKVDEINALNPDIVILGGDIVEEGTSNAEMHEVFRVLAKLQSNYGTFFIYGNHDRQRYTPTPAYSEAELAEAIRSNGIKILCDEYVEIGKDLLLVGREDLSARDSRAENAELMTGADKDRFILTADHQPIHAAENASLGTDLQLSGHTHSGQIFPLGLMTFLYNDLVCGAYRVDSSSVIVSSGFAGWGFPIRTQGVSEYVVVELVAE